MKRYAKIHDDSTLFDHSFMKNSFCLKTCRNLQNILVTLRNVRSELLFEYRNIISGLVLCISTPITYTRHSYTKEISPWGLSNTTGINTRSGLLN